MLAPHVREPRGAAFRAILSSSSLLCHTTPVDRPLGGGPWAKASSDRAQTYRHWGLPQCLGLSQGIAAATDSAMTSRRCRQHGWPCALSGRRRSGVGLGFHAASFHRACDYLCLLLALNCKYAACTTAISPLEVVPTFTPSPAQGLMDASAFRFKFRASKSVRRGVKGIRAFELRWRFLGLSAQT